MIGLLLLAAGASTRLGQPKQLLQFQGQSLLERSIGTAMTAAVDERLLVLGANANQIQDKVPLLGMEKLINPNWEEGMASSIRLGLNHLVQKRPSLDAVIIMLCDQPYVTPSLLNEFIAIYQETASPIVAAAYNDVLGVPALFAHGTFYKLLALQGDKGARAIIPDYQDFLQSVSFPKGTIDIDTPEDYQKWNAVAAPDKAQKVKVSH